MWGRQRLIRDAVTIQHCRTPQPLVFRSPPAWRYFNSNFGDTCNSKLTIQNEINLIRISWDHGDQNLLNTYSSKMTPQTNEAKIHHTLDKHDSYSNGSLDDWNYIILWTVHHLSSTHLLGLLSPCVYMVCSIICMIASDVIHLITWLDFYNEAVDIEIFTDLYTDRGWIADQVHCAVQLKRNKIWYFIPSLRSVISNVQTPNLQNLSKNTPSKSL
jgi:hypothetical protein